MKHTNTYKFRKGQKLHLDEIYDIQGLGHEVVGKWWEPDDGNGGEEVTITKDVEFTVTVRTPNRGAERTKE